MMDFIPEAAPAASIFDPIDRAKLSFDILDDVLGKPKKKGKKGKKGKNGKKGKKDKDLERMADIERAYIQLVFAHGYQSHEYDMLTRTVDLVIAASRGKLNDQLLELSMTALGRPRHIALPE